MEQNTGTSSVCSTHEARQRPAVFSVVQCTLFHTEEAALKMDRAEMHVAICIEGYLCAYTVNIIPLF